MGTEVYVTRDRRVTPFSFGRAIVLNEADPIGDSRAILMHEAAHRSHLHILDMILAQTVTILCWYNPVSWLLRNELTTVHEFQADAAVLRNGCAPRTYQMILVGRAAGRRFPSVIEHFDYSGLRRRISMMNRPDSDRRGISAYLLLPLALVAAVWTVSVPAVASVLSPARPSLRPMHIYVEGHEVPYDRLNEIPSSDIKSIIVDRQKDRIDIHTK